MSILGWVLAWCGSGLNNVTVDFGAEINKELSFRYAGTLTDLMTDMAVANNNRAMYHMTPIISSFSGFIRRH